MTGSQSSTGTAELLRELRLVANAGDLPPKGHPTLAQRAADEIERLLGVAQAGNERGVRDALDELRRDAKKVARELQQGLPKRNAAERLEAMSAAAQAALDAPQPRDPAYAESKPIGFMEAMDIVEAGFSNWKGRAHNAKWWRRIDGTPIPNDLAVNIAEAISRASLVSSTDREGK